MQSGRILISLAALLSLSAGAGAQTETKYVGVKTCAMCHRSEKQGNQLAVWQKSKHSQAFADLATPRADSIAGAKGLKKAAKESPECLECHVSGFNAAATVVDKNFDVKDGVQCETCHGAGSGYKTIALMKEKPRAVAAGLREYKDEKEVEKFCRTCHNERSPVYKEFNFAERWAKIRHPRPKG